PQKPSMRLFRPLRFLTAALLSLLLCALLARCSGSNDGKAPSATTQPTGAISRGSAKVQGVNLNDPIRPAAGDDAIVLGAAKNEWASFAVPVGALPKPASKKPYAYSLRVQAPRHEGSSDTIGVENLSAAQILPMPVDVNRAGFVRHTGLSASSRMLPRALLPVTMDKGVVNLAAVRDPADATNAQSHPVPGKSTEPLLFWIDLHVPPETPAGQYSTTCELLGSDSPQPIALVPVKITIHDFVLFDERYLIMTSQIGWDDLRRLYPKEFETVRPQLINRSDAAYAG